MVGSSITTTAAQAPREHCGHIRFSAAGEGELQSGCVITGVRKRLGKKGGKKRRGRRGEERWGVWRRWWLQRHAAEPSVTAPLRLDQSEEPARPRRACASSHWWHGNRGKKNNQVKIFSHVTRRLLDGYGRRARSGHMEHARVRRRARRHTHTRTQARALSCL